MKLKDLEKKEIKMVEEKKRKQSAEARNNMKKSCEIVNKNKEEAHKFPLVNQIRQQAFYSKEETR